MKKPIEIIDRIGARRIADAVGVQVDTVRKQRGAALLPCAWAPQVRNLAGQLSPPLFLPDDVFTFAPRRAKDAVR